MEKIKVLYTIPNFDTAGSGKALLQLALRLDPEKFEAHIACMHNRGSFFKTVVDSGIPVHIIPYTTPMKPYIKGLKACYAISKQLKAIAPDVIHSFHYASDYSEALAAKFAGIPWIYTKKNMSWGGGSKNAWKLRSYLARAIAVQNTDMQTVFFKDATKTLLIPRGVDTNLYQPQSPKDELGTQWNLQPSDRIVMCVANLVPVKGIEVLLQAFKKAQQLHPNWKLMLVGDCSHTYGERMQLLAKNLELDDVVVFCGKQQEVSAYLSIAELVVLPTLDKGEGSPVALLEAMSSGKTVLGSRVPGIKDQLADFSKYLVTAGDVNAWETALKQQFAQDETQLKKQGMVFRTHVCNHYTLEKEVALTEHLYLNYI